MADATALVVATSSVVPAAPTTVVTPPIEPKPKVQKQVQQTKQPELPSASDCVTQLKKIAQGWIGSTTGKVNNNPHLKVAQLITPLVTQLSIKDAVVDQPLVDKINALPKECPVLNPNWVPDAKQSTLPNQQAMKDAAIVAANKGQ